MSVSKNSAKSPLLPPAVRKLLKEHVLGTQYELSFAWVNSSVMRKLNNDYRHKDKPTNILSFPLAPGEGEIVMNRDTVLAEAPLFERTPKEHAHYLFIHGLLHLKGMRHGSKMENTEHAVVNFLLNHGKNNRSRTRHRNISHSSGRLRS